MVTYLYGLYQKYSKLNNSKKVFGAKRRKHPNWLARARQPPPSSNKSFP